MTVCSHWRDMTEAERTLFIAKLTAVVQYREGGYMAAKMMIEAAEAAGVFKGVKFGHVAVYDEAFKNDPPY